MGRRRRCSAPQHKCEQAKLKAQGALQACRKTNAAGIIAGKADTSAACQTKFTKALATADVHATKAGTSCRYIDDVDGTVNDVNTGLVWEKKTGIVEGAADLVNPENVNNTYTWSTSGTVPDGTVFTDFLAALNGGVSTDGGVTTVITGCLANHCDWRLPTIVELQGIVDLTAAGCGSGGPCIDAAFGPTQSGLSSGLYWSATTSGAYAVYPSYAWYVYFTNGLTYGYEKTSAYAVRAVRGGL